MSGPGLPWALRWAGLLAVTALWLAAGAGCVGGLRIVTGTSMEPTLSPGDWILVDRFTLRHRPPRVGEVVILEVPGRDGSAVVKRVSAVLAGGTAFEVRGDNRRHSLDSREFGRVGRERVLGRVVGLPGQSPTRSRLPGR